MYISLIMLWLEYVSKSAETKQTKSQFYYVYAVLKKKSKCLNISTQPRKRMDKTVERERPLPKQ